MAAKIYKINEAIRVVYQAANAKTGLTPRMQIFDETGQKDTQNFPDVTMSTIANAPGCYVGTFTPDAVGEWMILCDEGDGKGQVGFQYSVGNWNLHEVGEAVSDVADAVATVDGKVDTVSGKVDTVDGKVTTVDGKIDTLTTTVNGMDTQLDTIEDKIDDLAASEYTPPMIF